MVFVGSALEYLVGLHIWIWSILIVFSLIDKRLFDFQARTCPPNTIPCNGSCLAGTLRCDGKRDCDNGIDERDCPGNIFQTDQPINILTPSHNFSNLHSLSLSLSFYLWLHRLIIDLSICQSLLGTIDFPSRSSQFSFRHFYSKAMRVYLSHSLARSSSIWILQFSLLSHSHCAFFYR